MARLPILMSVSSASSFGGGQLFDLDAQLGAQLTGKPAGQFVGQLIQPHVPDQDPPAPLDDDISGPVTSIAMASCRYECGPPLPIGQLYCANSRARPVCRPCFNASRAIHSQAKSPQERSALRQFQCLQPALWRSAVRRCRIISARSSTTSSEFGVSTHGERRAAIASFVGSLFEADTSQTSLGQLDFASFVR